MRPYLQHGRRHLPGGTDPIPGGSTPQALYCRSPDLYTASAYIEASFGRTEEDVWVNCEMAFNQGFIDGMVANTDSEFIFQMMGASSKNGILIGDPTGLGHCSWIMEQGDPDPLASTAIVASHWYTLVFHSKHEATPLNTVSFSVDGTALTVSPHNTADNQGTGLRFGLQSFASGSGHDAVLYVKDLTCGTSSGANDLLDATDLTTLLSGPFFGTGENRNLRVIDDPF